MPHEALDGLHHDCRRALIAQMYPAQDVRCHPADLLNLLDGIRRHCAGKRPQALERLGAVPRQRVFPFVPPGAGTVVAQQRGIRIVQGRVQ